MSSVRSRRPSLMVLAQRHKQQPSRNYIRAMIVIVATSNNFDAQLSSFKLTRLIDCTTVSNGAQLLVRSQQTQLDATTSWIVVHIMRSSFGSGLRQRVSQSKHKSSPIECSIRRSLVPEISAKMEFDCTSHSQLSRCGSLALKSPDLLFTSSSQLHASFDSRA